MADKEFLDLETTFNRSVFFRPRPVIGGNLIGFYGKDRAKHWVGVDFYERNRHKKRFLIHLLTSPKKRNKWGVIG